MTTSAGSSPNKALLRGAVTNQKAGWARRGNWKRSLHSNLLLEDPCHAIGEGTRVASRPRSRLRGRISLCSVKGMRGPAFDNLQLSSAGYWSTMVDQ
jgi:hypothetical protein